MTSSGGTPVETGPSPMGTGRPQEGRLLADRLSRGQVGLIQQKGSG